MNQTIERLHKELKGKVDRHVFGQILGKTIADGLDRYLLYRASAESDQSEIDYSLVLVETLGATALSNKKFLDFLLFQSLTKRSILNIAKNLKIETTSVTDFRLRKVLSKQNSRKLTTAICRCLDLSLDFFKVPAKKKQKSHEVVTPYTPVPVNSKDLESEYLSLHDYQKRIKDRLIQLLLFDRPNSRMLVHMPTGSGKTKTCMEAVIDFIRVKLRLSDEGGTVVWFAHSKELCEQAYSTFISLWKYKGDFEVDVFKIFGQSSNRDVADKIGRVAVIFIGFQKFNSLVRSEDKLSRRLLRKISDTTRLAIVDEAHKSLATTYREAIDTVTTMPDCRLIGLTATPGRSNYVVGDGDNKELALFFGTRILRVTDVDGSALSNPLSYLQEEGVLAKIDFEEFEFELNMLSQGYTRDQLCALSKNSDVHSNVVELLTTEPHRNKLIVDSIRNEAFRGRKVLVFAASTDHCVILKRILETESVKSEIVLHDTADHLRRSYVDEFKDGELNVLINYGVLSTGFDAPKLNTLIVARPTKSIVLYSQIVGRALRGPRNGGNERNKLVTIKDNMTGFPDPDYMFSYWEEFWN